MQLELAFPAKHGGPRVKAGRPKVTDESVPHLRRPDFDGRRSPLHVTLRVRREVWNLRSQRGMRCVRAALARERALGAMRVVHYSVQGNHVHLIVEARDRVVLARRMQGFAIRLAKALNRMMRRGRGRVLAERYHARALTSPRQVHRAIRYVLGNAARHHAGPAVDPCSSGPWFDGWAPSLSRAAAAIAARAGPPETAAARTWLLAKGWRTLGAVAALRDRRAAPP